jgi:hypothetical protein
MSDVGAVSGSRQRCFSDEEVDAMRKDESTSAIVNKARRDAGFKEKDVTVRGDDKTLDEVLHHRPSHFAISESIGAAVHGYEVVEALGVGEKLAHAAGRLGIVGLGIATFLCVQGSMVEMEMSKAEMKDGATRDQLHAAILFCLDVPKGFKEGEMKKLDVTMTRQSAAGKVSDQFELGDKALVATLQLHCDEGMHAARTMLESNKDQAGFLKANPAIAKRYAEDVAFHNGFDALCWTKSKEAPPGAYDTQIKNLESRDARYSAAHITLRT